MTWVGGAVQVGELYAAPAHGIAYKPSRCAVRMSETERKEVVDYLAACPKSGKGEQDNLTKAERNELAELTVIRSAWRSSTFITSTSRADPVRTRMPAGVAGLSPITEIPYADSATSLFRVHSASSVGSASRSGLCPSRAVQCGRSHHFPG